MLDIKPIALIAQLVNFAIFIWVINRFMFTPIREVLKKRREEIEGTFASLADQKAEAAKLREQVETRIAGIENEIQEMKRQAIRDAQQQKDEILAEARAERERIVEKALVTAENETLRVLDQLQDHVALISVQVAEQILKREIDTKRHLDLVDAVIQKAEKLQWRTK